MKYFCYKTVIPTNNLHIVERLSGIFDEVVIQRNPSRISFEEENRETAQIATTSIILRVSLCHCLLLIFPPLISILLGRFFLVY